MTDLYLPDENGVFDDYENDGPDDYAAIKDYAIEVKIAARAFGVPVLESGTRSLRNRLLGPLGASPYNWATWLPAALRSDPVVAPKVIIWPGWEKIGRPESQFSFFPSGVLDHHTACFCRVGHDPQQCATFIQAGRTDAPGPISQLLGTMTKPGVKFNGSNWDPHIMVLAAGRANHAGTGVYPWGAPSGNASSIGIEWCLEGDTQVLTRRGLVAISEVKIGDEVWTHKSRWRPVTATQKFRNKPVVKVKPAGHPGLICTPDHLWWDGDGFTESSAMLGRDLVTPNVVSDEPVPTIDGFEVTPEMMRFVGAYVADGFVSISDRSRGPNSCRQEYRTIITPRYSKASIIEGWAQAAGLKVTRYGANERKGDRLTVWSKSLTEWLSQFGHRSTEKTIPTWLFGNNKLGEAFLEGYLHGDGFWDDERSCWSAGTSSRSLAVGLRLLATSLGWTPMLSKTHGGSFKPGSEHWNLRLYARPVREKSSGLRREGETLLGSVRKVEPVTESIDVYDITVEEDHSFLADGWISHNCGPVAYWPDFVIEFRARVTAALLRHNGWSINQTVTHQHYIPSRKVDPSGAWHQERHLGLTQWWSLPKWRTEIAKYVKLSEPTPAPTPEPTPQPTPEPTPITSLPGGNMDIIIKGTDAVHHPVLLSVNGASVGMTGLTTPSDVTALLAALKQSAIVTVSNGLWDDYLQKAIKDDA